MTDENLFRFLLIGVSVIQTVISVRYLRMAKAGSTILQHREEGILLTVGIGVCYLVFVAAVLAYYINPAWMAWSAVKAPAWLRWIGIAPLLFGACWSIWGLRHIGHNITMSIKTKEDHALITTGPYRWVRHPLYAGGMVESVGVCLLMANWFVVISAGLFWALIAYRTPMEEKKLIERFGEEYLQHIAKTGRYFPKMKATADKKSHGFWYWTVMAIILQIVIALPAGIAQTVGVIGGISGTPIWQRLLVPLMGIPFNCGGLTVRVIFEVLVEPLEAIVGHRSATVASNLGFYAVLLAVQVVIVTTIIVIRGRRSQSWFDPVIIAVSLLLLLNSLVNVTWPWWGT